MRLDRISDSASDRRKNKALRAAARPLGQRLRQVTTLDQVWIVVTDAAVVFGATHLRIGPSPAFTHEIEATGSNVSDLFEYRFMLPGNAGELELGWRDGRREIDRDTEIAVDLFCEHLADALERVKTAGAGRDRASRLDPTA